MARPAGEINAGSMADIAFLMLIFFLVTTTMDIDAGLQRRLPPMPEENQKQDEPKVHKRNSMVVLINFNDRLLVGGQPMDISQLNEKVKSFVLNPANDPNLPEKEVKEIAGIGAYPVSKGIISLQNDRGTRYDVYIQVQNELVRAYNELREDLSMLKFGRPYIKLDEEQQKSIQAAIPQAISEAEPRDISKKK